MAEPTHASCTEDAMVEQSQVREALCEIRLRYRSFVSHPAPHVCEMRRSSRDAANAATRGKCCHLPVTPANIRACYRQEATARPGPATTGCQSLMLDAAEA